MSETLVQRSCRRLREKKVAGRKRFYELVQKGLHWERGWFCYWQHEQETYTG